MNSTTSKSLHVVEQMVAALRSERLIEPSFYGEASLQSWFGEHRRSSKPSAWKASVLEEELVFGDSKLNIAHTSAATSSATSSGTPAGMSFSLMAPGAPRLSNLTADDLIRLLGQPQVSVDIVAKQTSAKPAYPQAAPGQIADSPQPIRSRGTTTHPLGNHDLTWQWKTAKSSVELNANINGDGSVETIFGRQQQVN